MPGTKVYWKLGKVHWGDRRWPSSVERVALSGNMCLTYTGAVQRCHTPSLRLPSTNPSFLLRGSLSRLSVEHLPGSALTHLAPSLHSSIVSSSNVSVAPSPLHISDQHIPFGAFHFHVSWKSGREERPSHMELFHEPLEIPGTMH